MQSIHLNFQSGDMPSLHPHLTAGHLRGCCLSKLLFECLTRMNAEGKAELAGAKSVKISPDSMNYIFTLRDQKWSDGSLVTAFQYENAWKRAMKPEVVCYKAELFYRIKNAKEIKQGKLPLSDAGVKALDEKTLMVELASPCPAFLQLIAHHIFAPLKNPDEDQPKNFNGGFLVDEWKKGESISLKKNLNFWNEQNVFLQNIHISFVSDPITAIYLYDNGDIDWIGSPFGAIPLEAISSFEDQKILRKQYSSFVLWIYFNTKCPPYQSGQIRRAFNLAVDREAINQHIVIGKPLTSPLPHSLSLMNHRNLYDRELAQKLFAEGIHEQGLTAETFPAVQLRCVNNPRFKGLAQYLQQSWQEAFGIKVNLECTDWNTFISALQEGSFQIGGFYEMPAYADPLDVLERFEILNFSNLSRWTHPEFQEKLSRARGFADEEQRNHFLKEAEQILVDESPVIPVSAETQVYAHHPALKGYVFDFSGAMDLSYAYFEQ